MAIELLLFAPPHRTIHDAESLIYVLLFLCSHLDGPGSVAKSPLFGSGSTHPSGIRYWLSASNLKALGHIKYSHMSVHFDVEILQHLSTYFKTLGPHILKLWDSLSIGKKMDASASHSLATLRDLINAFKVVLMDETLKATATSPSSSRKRSYPGEQVMSSNGWDVAPAKKKYSRKRRRSVLRG